MRMPNAPKNSPRRKNLKPTNSKSSPTCNTEIASSDRTITKQFSYQDKRSTEGAFFSKAFRSSANITFLQHECMPSVSPMHKKEKPRFTQCPPSILRKRSSMKQALRERQKVERRVRFREPGEIITNAHKRTVRILPLFLGLSFCVVMLLAASLYYNSRKQDFKVLEEFYSHLLTILLLIRRTALKFWTWFLRQ
ncbi:uncharacterized protein M6D78_005055 [Vipera latastei]